MLPSDNVDVATVDLFAAAANTDIGYVTATTAAEVCAAIPVEGAEADTEDFTAAVVSEDCAAVLSLLLLLLEMVLLLLVTMKASVTPGTTICALEPSLLPRLPKMVLMLLSIMKLLTLGTSFAAASADNGVVAAGEGHREGHCDTTRKWSTTLNHT